MMKKHDIPNCQLVLDEKTHQVYRCPNGYGASIINGPYSYGLELAVVKFYAGDLHYFLTYDTPITDDVLGYLTDDEVADLLVQISTLSTKKGELA